MDIDAALSRTLCQHHWDSPWDKPEWEKVTQLWHLWSLAREGVSERRAFIIPAMGICINGKLGNALPASSTHAVPRKLLADNVILTEKPVTSTTTTISVIVKQIHCVCTDFFKLQY